MRKQTAVKELMKDMQNDTVKPMGYYLRLEKELLINAFELGNEIGHKGRLPSGEGYYNKVFEKLPTT